MSKITKQARRLAVAVVLTVGLMLSAQVSAMPAIGTNAVLDGMGGELYIPFKPSYSGVLGALIGGGPNHVGMQSDSVTLSSSHPNSSGFVTFELVFDITADLGIFPSLDRNSTALLLSFDDIDFKTTSYSNFTLNEVLTMQFRDDPGGAGSGSPLTIDQTNYWVYSGLPAGHNTNNVSVVYEINLKNDLGIAESDFLDMEADKDFALLVTFRADLHWTGGDHGSTGVSNSSETIGNRFTLVGVPEPATLSLLALGGLLIRRRK